LISLDSDSDFVRAAVTIALVCVCLEGVLDK